MTLSTKFAGGPRLRWPAAPGGMIRWMWLIVATLIILSAVGLWRSGVLFDARGSASPADLPLPFPTAARSWDEHVDAIDRAIMTHRERAAREPSDWISPSAEAASWLDRAQMTGRWQDYKAAEVSLAIAMERAPPAAAPHLLNARFALAVHRLTEVEPALSAATADLEFARAHPQATATALRGDLALYRGNWREAEQLYLRAAALFPSESTAFRRAFIVERTQGADRAITAWLDVLASTDRPTRPLIAAVALRIGGIELARGRWEQAARWHAQAERYLPGDWRIAARRLQDQALAGELEAAIAGMTRLAERHDRPELWDALANWHRFAGSAAASAAALDRGRAGWASFASHFRLATAAHQAEHALIAGDSAAALRYAEADFANRPYGEAAMLRAAAQLAAGAAADARRTLGNVAASGWHSPGLDRLRFEAALFAGDTAAAERFRAAAERASPRAFDARASLILFGLH